MFIWLIWVLLLKFIILRKIQLLFKFIYFNIPLFLIYKLTIEYYFIKYVKWVLKDEANLHFR